MIPLENVLGRNSNHITFDLTKHVARPVHIDIVEHFLSLQADAALAGFDLQLVSGFRDFDRQLAIWCAKAEGQRALLDDKGNELYFKSLTQEELLFAILRWSALPGASRHHWGTDVDVFDAASVADDYDVQLTPAEVENGGPFSALHDWLDQQISAGNSHGFFRPYSTDLGGIAPERWHLSYASLSSEFQQTLTKQALIDTWKTVNLPLLPQVEKNLDIIWDKFIWINDEAYP